MWLRLLQTLQTIWGAASLGGRGDGITQEATKRHGGKATTPLSWTQPQLQGRGQGEGGTKVWGGVPLCRWLPPNPRASKVFCPTLLHSCIALLFTRAGWGVHQGGVGAG